MSERSFFKYFILVFSAITSGFLFYFLTIGGGGEILSNAISTRINQNENIALQTQIFQEGIKENNNPVQIDTASLYFVGDIMFDRGVAQSVKENFDGDYGALFENVEFLKEADVLFGNLEGPVSDEGYDTGKKYSFRMDPEVIPALKEAGFDVVSFANNHVADWGQEAFTDTIIRLRDNEIQAAGAGFYRPESQAPRVLVKNGIKIGYLAFSDVGPRWFEAQRDKPGILLANDPYFDDIIDGSAKIVDFLVVSLHFGKELENKHNERQEELARRAIDSGAKLVIGHHPHVIQDIEYYNSPAGKGLIVYSLGNFIFEAYSEETTRGLLLETIIARNPFTQKVEIIDTRENIIKLSQSFQPQMMEEIEITKIAKITRSAEFTTETQETVPTLREFAFMETEEEKTEGVKNIEIVEEEPEIVSASSEIKIEETKAAESSAPNTPNEVSREEIIKVYSFKNIYSRGPRQNKIALTIDDGWNIDRVNEALNILEKENVRATLFPVGVILEKNPAVWKRALELGMEIGNHTFTHPFWNEIDKERVNIEIIRWQEAASSALGDNYKQTWFRPPWMRGFERGEVDKVYYDTLKENKLKVALWSLGTWWDIYKDKGLDVEPKKVAEHVIKKTTGGEIILLHFIKPDIDALPLIIQGLKQKGFKFVTLSELLGD